MSPFALGIGVLVALGALLAVSVRDPRFALGGLVLAFALGPLVAEPLPGPAALLARFVAAAIGGELLVIALRGRDVPALGSPLGVIAPGLAAAAAFAIGLAAPGLGGDALGSPAAGAAGAAAIVLGLAPLMAARDLARRTVGATVLVLGATLVRVGLAGTPGGLEQLATGALAIGLLGSLALILGRLSGGTMPTGEGGRPSVSRTAPPMRRYGAHPIVERSPAVDRSSAVERAPAVEQAPAVDRPKRTR